MFKILNFVVMLVFINGICVASQPHYQVELQIKVNKFDSPSTGNAIINFFDGTVNGEKLPLMTIPIADNQLKISLPASLNKTIIYQAREGYYEAPEPPVYASLTFEDTGHTYFSSCFYKGSHVLQYGKNIDPGAIEFKLKQRPACRTN